MATYPGTAASEIIDIRSWGAPVFPENAHGVNAGSGHDTVYGSSYNDLLFGEDGNDIIFGYNGNDLLLGGNGNDYLNGGAGDDRVFDTFGNDTLYGGLGDDLLWGGEGNDTYLHDRGDGIDIINDNMLPNGTVGYGGGNDKLIMGYSSSEIYLFSLPYNNNLYITTLSDVSDGYFDEGVIIENFFLGGNYVVELLLTSNNVTIDLMSIL